MINPAWLFALASVISVLGILISFKKLIKSVRYRMEYDKLNQEILQTEQSRYFIRVALIATLPILFIIVGFILKQDVIITDFSVAVATIIILGVLLFATVHVLLAYRELQMVPQNNSAEHKPYINTLLFLGMATVNAIPAISLIALYIS
ncbi:hypothetical protein [Aquibacillus rhizosphaerae]|uniref:DUF350 domain-containing protein n=1 Tax=Aquibacillus rhizosphaerae TaxID=3051431 RepID=A0ABT7L2Q4_9BACI|nr:hypothetical protein [Aquibacillus sp. LR5S19]MDL4840150.1 hypothetical protein [Aquibacillus sp. LR5S19]